MKRETLRSRPRLHTMAALLLLSLCSACSTDSAGSVKETGGNTSWLSSCERDADCSGVCARGACTVTCSTEGDCQQEGGGCFDAAIDLASDCVEPSARSVCLPKCERDADCSPFGGDFACAGGFCHPDSSQCVNNEDTNASDSNGAPSQTTSGSDESTDPLAKPGATDEASGGTSDASDDAAAAPSGGSPSDSGTSASETPTPADGGATSPDSSEQDDGSVAESDDPSEDVAVTDASVDVTDPEPELCGGEVCGDDQFCCGPPECGACVFLTQGPQCGDTCPGDETETSSNTDTELRLPECPGEFERCDSTRCVDGQPCVTCGVGQICVEIYVSCGAQAGSTAQCVDDPCAGETLDCSCAESVCSAADVGFPLSCGVNDQDSFLVGADREPFLSCSGGGVCASPDTLIATPDGNRRIDTLRAGDLVYSRDTHGTRVVPLLQVARTPVVNHSVLRVLLDDGAQFEISGPHPSADGRRLDSLAPGAELDGRQIVSVERIPYTHAFTYDILPASSSATYVANGVWMGSTLD